MYDGILGNIYLCQDAATASGRAGQFRFFSNMPERWVTPLVFEAEDADTYRLVCIGRSLRSDGSGIQRQAFEPLCGSAELRANHHYLGTYDGQVELDAGDILTLRPNLGTVSFLLAQGNGPWAHHYSALGTTGPLRLGLRFSRLGRVDEEPYSISPGRICSAQLSIEPVP